MIKTIDHPTTLLCTTGPSHRGLVHLCSDKKTVFWRIMNLRVGPLVHNTVQMSVWTSTCKCQELNALPLLITQIRWAILICIILFCIAASCTVIPSIHPSIHPSIDQWAQCPLVSNVPSLSN